MRSLIEGNYKIIGEWTQSYEYEYAQKIDFSQEKALTATTRKLHQTKSKLEALLI